LRRGKDQRSERRKGSAAQLEKPGNGKIENEQKKRGAGVPPLKGGKGRKPGEEPLTETHSFDPWTGSRPRQTRPRGKSKREKVRHGKKGRIGINSLNGQKGSNVVPGKVGGDGGFNSKKGGKYKTTVANLHS